MPKLFLVFASINACLAVALGAFAAHGLRNSVAENLLSSFQTGVQYHMYHSLALFGVGLLALNYPSATLLKVSAYLFLAGIVFFSGSLYLLAITGVRWLGAITPIGGVAFLAGWALLTWFVISTELPR